MVVKLFLSYAYTGSTDMENKTLGFHLSKKSNGGILSSCMGCQSKQPQLNMVPVQKSPTFGKKGPIIKTFSQKSPKQKIQCGIM